MTGAAARRRDLQARAGDQDGAAMDDALVDEPELTMWQFSQRPGSDADRRAHRSVMRGDPNPERHRTEYADHLTYCGVCRGLEGDCGANEAIRGGVG